jgi:hypothetical protein
LLTADTTLGNSPGKGRLENILDISSKTCRSIRDLWRSFLQQQLAFWKNNNNFRRPAL